LYRIVSQPIPSSPASFPNRTPPYPTDYVASNDGTPGSYEPLTTSPRPDLYAPLSASRTTFATTHSFVVARIRYRPRHMSAASSTPPHSQASAMPLFQNVLYPCLVLVAPSFSLYILYVLSTLVRHCYRLFFAVTPRGLVDGSLYHLYYPTCLFFSFIPLDRIY
jgi:hypothetical protein